MAKISFVAKVNNLSVFLSLLVVLKLLLKPPTSQGHRVAQLRAALSPKWTRAGGGGRGQGGLLNRPTMLAHY